jgi:hypothetical protein
MYNGDVKNEETLNIVPKKIYGVFIVYKYCHIMERI